MHCGQWLFPDIRDAPWASVVEERLEDATPPPPTAATVRVFRPSWSKSPPSTRISLSALLVQIQQLTTISLTHIVSIGDDLS